MLDGAGGFLTPSAERTFQWSASGRLDRVLVGLGSPVQVSRYWYAPDGNRTAEQVTPESGASWTQARRFGGTRLTEELGGVVKQATTWSFAGNAVGQSHTDADPAVPGGQVVTLRWTGGDHLGSASVVTDEGGQLMRGVRYEPYGRVRDEWGPETDPDDYASAGLDDLFNGKPRTRDAFGMAGTERELEGYDYGARIYLPELSRFASADTITPDLVWEANAFAYVRNNPLKYVDPDGHAVETVWDVVNVVLDGASLVGNIGSGNWVGAAIDAGCLFVDGAATVLPGIPGGAGVLRLVAHYGDDVAGLWSAIWRAADQFDASSELWTRIVKFKNATAGHPAGEWVETLVSSRNALVNQARVAGSPLRLSLDGRKMKILEFKIGETLFDGFDSARKVAFELKSFTPGGQMDFLLTNNNRRAAEETAKLVRQAAKYKKVAQEAGVGFEYLVVGDRWRAFFQKAFREADLDIPVRVAK